MNDSQKKPCPECGRYSLVVQQLPDGSTEMSCMDLDCDFGQIVPSAGPAPGGPAGSVLGDGSFENRVRDLSRSRLNAMNAALGQSVDQLSGRAKCVAQRQRAIVRAELERRDGAEGGQSTPAARKSDAAGSNMPPHLDTPEVRRKRRQAIRAYHQRIRALKQAEQGYGQCDGQGADSDGRTGELWLATLTRTLRHEARRHERAARDYSRTPELFALQIDHSARAFELNRVLDLLTGCTDPDVEG